MTRHGNKYYGWAEILNLVITYVGLQRLVHRTRTVRRLPLADMFNKELIDELNARPWKTHRITTSKRTTYDEPPTDPRTAPSTTAKTRQNMVQRKQILMHLLHTQRCRQISTTTMNHRYLVTLNHNNVRLLLRPQPRSHYRPQKIRATTTRVVRLRTTKQTTTTPTNSLSGLGRRTVYD